MPSTSTLALAGRLATPTEVLAWRPFSPNSDKHQIRGAVDDFGNIRIVRPRQDESAEPVAADHAVEISVERKAERCQEVERAKLSGLLTGGEIERFADPAGITNLTIPFANLAGEEHKRARAGVRFERSARLRHRRQFQAKSRQAVAPQRRSSRYSCRRWHRVAKAIAVCIICLLIDQTTRRRTDGAHAGQAFLISEMFSDDCKRCGLRPSRSSES